MKLFLFTVLLAAVAAKVRYDGYVVLEMSPNNPQQLDFLVNWMETDITVDFWLEPHSVGAPCHVMLSPEQMPGVKSQLHANGIAFSTLISDVQADIDSEGKQRKRDFDLDDFNTYDDIVVWLHEQEANCDAGYVCDLYTIGKTYEGRDLWVFHVRKPESSNVAHWIDSAIHAREWLAPATVLNIMDKVLNEPNDEDVDALLDDYQLYFMPVMNPDGYDYTFTNERLWRKNRSPNAGSNCLGTDLNRNYEHNWGMEGVSHLACADTFCGASSASELETQAVQAEALRLVALHSPLASWITVHTYGQMWMWPWGNTVNHEGQVCQLADDHADLMYVGEATAEAIMATHGTTWLYGNGCEVIYETTGSTDDYVKAIGVKYAICAELRGNGFIVNSDQIQPSFEEIWNGFLVHVDKIAEELPRLVLL